MKRFSILCLIAFLGIFSSCGRRNSAILFDGGHTGNWRTYGNVFVRDSALVLGTADDKAVLKQSNYRDFNLTFEARADSGARGGVWFHTNGALRKGYTVAINNNLQDSVWWRMTGSLLSVRNLTHCAVRDGEWFRMGIRVEGHAVTVTLNGEPVVEYLEPETPYRESAHADATLSSGTFVLLNESDAAIAFRNIRVTVAKEKTWNSEEQLANAIDETTDEIIRLHQADFPVLDYHVHLKGGLTKEAAAAQSRRTGINYAVAPNCGLGFPIQTDKQIKAYVDTMRTQPFLMAMQAEGREWVDLFSPAAREKFDFVFTDALTFTDNKGNRTRLWIPEETWIGPREEERQAYMDMIVNRICAVLREPVDVYVNPCYLPDTLSTRYDEYWTEARVDKFIDSLAASGKALEINELYQIPNKMILMRAKALGVKFTFGSNNITPEVSTLSYGIRMMKECGLTANDMYRPRREQGGQ